MKITTVLFDLDGTLLPMDQDEFIKAYFGLLAQHMAPYGYEKEKLLKTIWASTGSMIHNNTGRTNEGVNFATGKFAHDLTGEKTTHSRYNKCAKTESNYVKCFRSEEVFCISCCSNRNTKTYGYDVN